MPCGQYCYQRKWQCQGGRLRQLTNVQKQPGPTRNYGSEGARQNSIRRRVMSVKTTGSKTNYGPLFGGKKKPSVFSNCGFCGDRSVEEGKNVYYNNGGTSGTNTYWNKIAAGPKGVKGMTCCCQDEQIVTISSNELGWCLVLPKPQVGWAIAVWSGDYDGDGPTWVGEITRIIDDSNLTADAEFLDATYGVHPFSRACGGTPAWAAAALENPWFTASGAFPNITGGGVLVMPRDPANFGYLENGTGTNVTATPPRCPGRNRLCGGDNGTTLLGGAPCSLGGKNWLNYRRFHPGAAKA